MTPTPTPYHMEQVTTYIQTDMGDAGPSSTSDANRFHSLDKQLHVMAPLNASIQTESSLLPPRSPNDTTDIQLGYSTSFDASPYRSRSNSSLVSIGSPRSVFAPVNSTFERKVEKLLPPSTNTSDLNMKGNGNVQDNSKFGGVLGRWQAAERNNAEAVAAKSKPIEYRFKPIPNTLDTNENAAVIAAPIEESNNVVVKEQHPEVKKSALSSRARMRARVPFAFIEVRDMDDESCTTVSSMSYDPSEFDVEALYSFANRHKTDFDANKALLEETNEILKRIARHNIEAQEENEGDDLAGQQRYGIQPQKMSDVDKQNSFLEQNHQLDGMEELPMPDDIAALIEEDEEREHSRDVDSRRINILNEMDNDFSNLVKLQHQYSQQNPKQLPPDINALVEDNDLSFDDLRVDSEDNGEEEENTSKPINSTERALDNAVEKDDCAGSDDEGLSFEKDVAVGILVDLNAHPKPSPESFQPEINFHFDKRDDWVEDPGQVKKLSDMRQSSDKDVNDILQMLDPKMYEKSNIKSTASPDIHGIASAVNDKWIKDSRRSVFALAEDSSEQGGIANIVQELSLKKKGQQEEWTRRSDSPPIKEIYIPVNHEFSFGFHEPTGTIKAQCISGRVRTKKDNDWRIQNIIKRGKERFLRGLKKKNMTVE